MTHTERPEAPTLRSLDAHFIDCEYERGQRLVFRCPNCEQRMIVVNIWSGKATTLEYEPGKTINLHHAEQGPNKDWETLTIEPSINDTHGKPSDHGCTGWHGFVRNGICQ